MPDNNAQQSQLWPQDEHARLYSELCNAFYTREILMLSQVEQLKPLQKRLASLPYYIERAATHILDGNCPLVLDSQNGGWIAKQRKTSPKHEPEATALFYRKYAFAGLIVPVLVYEGEFITVRIDSLDQVSEQQLHCNQFGWFDFCGQSTASHDYMQLLKPSKANFSAACCGHRWLGQKGRSPRILSLREMLLAARINWQNFKRPLMAKR